MGGGERESRGVWKRVTAMTDHGYEVGPLIMKGSLKNCWSWVS